MSIYIGFIKEIYQFDSLALRTKFFENEFHANANLEVIAGKQFHVTLRSKLTFAKNKEEKKQAYVRWTLVRNSYS